MFFKYDIYFDPLTVFSLNEIILHNVNDIILLTINQHRCTAIDIFSTLDDS